MSLAQELRDVAEQAADCKAENILKELIQKIKLAATAGLTSYKDYNVNYSNYLITSFLKRSLLKEGLSVNFSRDYSDLFRREEAYIYVSW